MMSKTIQLLILALFKVRQTNIIYSTNFIEYCMIYILALRKGDFIKNETNKSTVYH